jgi:hypothetical protein
VACEKRYEKKKKKRRILELGLRVATAWRRGGDFTRRGTGSGGELEAKDGGGGYGYATVRSDVKQKKKKEKKLIFTGLVVTRVL